MYDHQLRSHGEALAQNQALPKNTQTPGNGGPQRAGSMMGAAEAVVKAVSPVTVAAGKSLTVILEDGDDAATLTALPLTFKLTAGASVLTRDTGAILGRIPLPSDCRRYVRVVLGTDDASASGAVDVFFQYLPR